MTIPFTDRRTFLTRTVGALGVTLLRPDVSELLPTIQGPPIRLGVVGVGRQGRAILAELQKIPQAEIAAVCDTADSRLAAAADRAPGAEAFADHRDLLARRDDIGAIVVATPTHRHRAIVDDVIAAGRHVYCEAPVASTIDDCVALAEAASGATTVCQAGLLGRSNPTYRRAQPLVRTELRELVLLAGQAAQKTSWRFPASGGLSEREANWRLDPEVSVGLAGEIGVQQFDVTHWFRREYPVRVAGRGAVRLHRDGRTIADSIELDVTWADGVALRYDATLASSYGGQAELFRGANATIRLAWTHGWLFKEADAPTQGWEVYATRQEVFGEEGIVLIADATQLAAQGRLQDGAGLPYPPLYYALVDFVRSVSEGADVACSLAEGARATVVAIAANQAVVTGRPVDVPPLPTDG
jgi:predicted dehydrogenase